MGSLRHNKYFSGFDPRDVPGCQLWLDGADSSTFTLSGSNITTWNDKSGMGRNAVQYNTGFATYDSAQQRVVITTTGQLAAPVAAGTFSAGVSCFVVFQKYGANTTYDTIVTRTNGAYPAPFDLYYINETTTSRLVGNGSSTNYTGFNDSSSIPRLTTTTLYYFNVPGNVSWSESTNGTTPSSVPSSVTVGTPVYGDTGTQIYIGTRGDKITTANVYIYEIVFYSGSLTTSQRQQVEGYLAWKWGRETQSITSPLSLSNCYIWSDANTLSGVANGTTVGSWTNLGSGGTITATGTVSNAVLNGRTVVNFTTSQTWTTGTAVNLSSYSLFAVCRQTGGANNRVFQSTTNNQLYGYWAGYKKSLFIDSSPGQLTTATSDTNWDLMSHTRVAGGAYTFNWYGSNTFSGSTSTANNMTGLAINTGTYTGETSACQIAEIILYSRVLSSSEVQQVEDYLATKWAVQVIARQITALPVTHPFYRSPPYTRAFNPLDITGCTLWLDGADGGSMTLSGSNITQWRDKSGLGSNATAGGTPVLVQNALASNSVVYFNGSSYFTGSQSDTNNTHSVLAVVRFNSAGPQYARLVSFGVNGQFDYNNAAYYNLSSNTSTLAVTRNGVETGVAGLTSDAYHIVTAIFNGTNGLYYVDGGMLSNSAAWTSNFNFNQYRVGADQIPTGFQQLQGNVGEIITYSNALSTTERLQLERYLGWKWNISNQISRPTDIAGCTLWLDAADPNALVLSGSTVTQWRDKSGNGNHTSGSSGTTTYRTNGISTRGSLYFNSTYLTGGFASTFTGTEMSCFIVASVSSSSSQYSRLLSLGRPGVPDQDSPSTCIPFVKNSGVAQIYAVNNNVGTTPNNVTYDTPFLSRTYFLSNLIANNVNGSTTFNTVATTASFNITSYGLGISTSTADASRYTGEICEIICYFGSSLTTSQAQQVEKYLARKWSILASIPSSTLSLDIPPRTTVFSPSQISGLALWLDGGDRTTITLSGTNITHWNDKSGNGRTAVTQGSSYPTYSENSVLVAPPQYMNCANTGSLLANTAYTVFVVEKVTGSVSGALFGDSGGAGDNKALHTTYLSTSSLRFGYYANDLDVTVTGTNVTRIWTFNQPSTANRNIRLNGALIGTHTNSTKLGALVSLNLWGIWGYPGGYTGNFYEFIVVLGEPTLAQQEQVEGYLASKWGLQGSLPAAHPYVKITP
jgi:hypothetical protein